MTYIGWANTLLCLACKMRKSDLKFNPPENTSGILTKHGTYMNQRQKRCWEQERWIYVSLQAGREGRQDPSQSIPSGLLASWGSITGKKGARAKLRLNKSVLEDRVLCKNHLTWSLDNLPGFPQNLLFQNGSNSTANFYFATVKVL